jgi:acyl-CoA thioesterase
MVNKADNLISKSISNEKVDREDQNTFGGLMVSQSLISTHQHSHIRNILKNIASL